MLTITIPQAASIYRPTKSTSYSYDENTAQMTVNGICVISEVSFKDWGLMQMHYRKQRYTECHLLAMSLLSTNQSEYLF